MSYGSGVNPYEFPGLGDAPTPEVVDDGGVDAYWDTAGHFGATLEEMADRLWEIHMECCDAAGWEDQEGELYDAWCRLSDMQDSIRRQGN